MPKKSAVAKKSDGKNKKFSEIKTKISAGSPLVAKNKPEKVGRGSVEKILVENFVSLQRVMVNLSVKLDNLAGQISQLLNLFEISAKSLAERGGDMGGSYEKRIIEKMDNLLDQNKTIARGVALLHEGGAEEVPGSMPPQKFRPLPQSAPKFSGKEPPSSYESDGSVEGYQKSISSKEQSSGR